MRYWVYINDKVDGPYEETNLVTLEGFTPDTLICSEEVASNGGQEWVKASSIFEFDEVPVNELAVQAAQEPTPATAQPLPDAQTQALLAKLEALTAGMSNLQAKLDSVQTDLNHALEQNKQLAEKVSQLSPEDSAPQTTPVSDEPHANTITLTRHDMSALQKEAGTAQKFPAQAAPEEEEVIIRSALDSLYGGKPVELEDTFQDLLPEKTAEQEARKAAEEEQAVHSIEPELEFIPVAEENKTEQTQNTPFPTEEAEPLPAEALDEIEKEMTSISLGEAAAQTQTDSAAEETPVVKEALITTPSADETAKDALINELTASPKEDILDQIIAEHQQEQSAAQPAQQEADKTAPAGEIALGAAAAGLAAASLVSLVDNKAQAQEAPMAIATDKEHPQILEEVLPAEQMPEDVPAVQPEPLQPADLPAVPETPAAEPTVQPQEEPLSQPELPSVVQTPAVEQPAANQQTAQPAQPEIPVADMPEELPQPAQEESEPAAADLPGLDDRAAFETAAQQTAQQAPEPAQQMAEETMQELVPSAAQPQAQPEAEPEGFYVKEEPAAQPQEESAQAETPVDQSEAEVPVSEEAPVQEPQEEPVHIPGAITDKDLEDAFGSDDTQPVVQTSTVSTANEEVPAGNPNDLTEIELKEGSTYLISDFVPPAQVTDNVAELMQSKEEEKKDKNQETAFQDMLATVTKAQTTTPLNTDGLMDDLAATSVNLENTIQAKRGASLDIKTVPMVPEPENTERLEVNELNDVNATHDLKTSAKLTKSTKTVIVALVGLLILIILYVLLGMLKLLPASVNLFAGKQPAATQATQELLTEEQPVVPQETQQPQEPTLAQQAQEKVQNFPLPNGYQLKGFIESKHPTIDPELITWETTEAVEPDNYSVTVKVPPENPQNFKTVYRFNYNMLSGLLDPTISDAKNLLDQAYGVSAQATTPATNTTSANRTQTTRRNTTRKR